MAESTRSKTQSDKLYEMLHQLSIFQESVTHQFQNMGIRLSALERHSPSPPPSPPPLHTPFSSSSQRHFLKLDVPRFDGTDALGWIFKITQFFDYHNTPKEERITVASFYLDGPALAWFQWMFRNGQIQSWHQLLQALENRFAPTAFDDPRGKLFKLTQSSSVTAYLTEFESLANRIVGLQPSFLLSCFISGLKSEIRRDVAVGFARLHEEKLQDHSRTHRLPSSQSWTPTSVSRTFSPSPISTSPKPFPPLLPAPPPKTRYKQLTEAEMAEKHEKGLCFDYDQKFSCNHRCPARYLLLIADEDDDTIIAGDVEQHEELKSQGVEEVLDTSSLPAQLSLNALSSTGAPETLQILGLIAQYQVRVLVDEGSTHNFIQQKSPTVPLKVLVGSGEELACNQCCHGVELLIQGHKFLVDLFVLDMGGSDVVLGAHWLKHLGPILMDYQALTMKFFHRNQLIELKGDSGHISSSISIHQLKRVIRSDHEAQLYSLQVLSPTPTSLTSSHISHPNTAVDHLLLQYTKLFAEPTHLPPSRPTDHQIPLISAANPVNVRSYRYPHAHKIEIEKQISMLLDSGWITPSTSPFSSPVLLLRKKDGSWRMCVDYRALNAVTIKDRFPLPTIDELLDELRFARCFSKLDLTSGFHQIRLHPSDSYGHYEFRVMPFGLCNAPATFQATMNDIFRPLLRKSVIVFFDDILVFSTTIEEHLLHLRQVFDILLANQFYLKSSKCSFAQSQIDYLGHVVANGCVAPDPTKVQAMVAWPVPSSLKALRGYLGLTGFYRKFVKGYAAIAFPLIELLKKGAFHWSSEAQRAFEALKTAMVGASVLALPNFSQPFILQTDASGATMGVVLVQDSHPIAYFSKVFCPRLTKALAYIRELHAITSAVKRWRQYLLGNFFIQTDQKSLKELLTQVIQTPEQQYYVTKLLGYDYEIQYKPGKLNVVADSLSRSVGPTNGELKMLFVPQCDFLDELKKSFLEDQDYILLRQKCIDNPESMPHFKVGDGLMLFKGKIWLNSTSRFITLLLKEFHETVVGGHASVTKTLKRLSANFYWASMAKDVRHFISQCRVCQQTKYSTKRSNGLLIPLPIPSNIWEDISMDFIMGLPLSHGYTVLLVVVDRFSKAVHLGALPTSYTAYRVAEFRFWLDLFKFSGTLLRMSSSYHPQTDGQTEVMNRTIEQYLRAFVHDKPQHWFRYLPWVEFHYNTSVHSGSEMSPFQVMYGKPPPSIPEYLKRMKKNADLKRKEVNFDVGSWVYVKLQPYCQISVSGSKFHKLAKRFYGPFQVVAKMGPVAYKLDLPDTSRIHNVFHCSVLKAYEGPLPPSIDPLTPLSYENNPLVTPLAILGFKTNTVNGVLKRLALVQWQGLSPDDTSWEDWSTLQQIYDLEDKVIAEGDGNENQLQDSPPKPPPKSNTKEKQNDQSRSMEHIMNRTGDPIAYRRRLKHYMIIIIVIIIIIIVSVDILGSKGLTLMTSSYVFLSASSGSQLHSSCWFRPSGDLQVWTEGGRYLKRHSDAQVRHILPYIIPPKSEGKEGACLCMTEGLISDCRSPRKGRCPFPALGALGSNASNGAEGVSGNEPLHLHLHPHFCLWHFLSKLPPFFLRVSIFSPVSRTHFQVTMASSSVVYDFSDNVEGERSDPLVAQPVVTGCVTSLLSGDRVFVHGGVAVDIPEEGCSSSLAEYSWASHEVGEQESTFSSKETLLGWVEDNCILRNLGYHRALKLIACRRDERVFHGEDVVRKNCFFMYMHFLYDMYVRLPLTRFQMDVLRCLNVAPSQLHPNGWGYIQSFGVLCQALDIEPTAKIFLFFFKTRPNAKRGWVSLTSMAKNSIFSLFVESYKDFKNQFFKVSVTEMGRPFFLNDDGSSRFPLYWTKKPHTLTSWLIEDMSDVERRDLDRLVKLPRPFSSRKMVNCLKYNDLKSKVSEVMAKKGGRDWFRASQATDQAAGSQTARSSGTSSNPATIVHIDDTPPSPVQALTRKRKANEAGGAPKGKKATMVPEESVPERSLLLGMDDPGFDLRHKIKFNFDAAEEKTMAAMSEQQMTEFFFITY
ncbi:hypothetical protein V8G54_033345 [Vigna mungo]|uniref:Ty3/gypsy retrotransposon protein n=1 Tax=Vigna mungo TaxID=3915 RepID=A0AAQ3RIR4_VIGMU